MSASVDSELQHAAEQQLPATNINNININGVNIITTVNSPEPPQAFTVIETEAAINRSANLTETEETGHSPSHVRFNNTNNNNNNVEGSVNNNVEEGFSSNSESEQLPPLASPEVFGGSVGSAVSFGNVGNKLMKI